MKHKEWSIKIEIWRMACPYRYVNSKCESLCGRKLNKNGRYKKCTEKNCEFKVKK